MPAAVLHAKHEREPSVSVISTKVMTQYLRARMQAGFVL
jgi:hypothetical protein